MFRKKEALHAQLEHVLISKEAQGFDVAELKQALFTIPFTYDALVEFSEKIKSIPMRADWPYVEPVAWEEILGEIDPPPRTGIFVNQAQTRTLAAFLTSS